MSLIRLVIADATEVIYGEPHGSETDRIAASLAAEPETIDELELALKRFSRESDDRLLRRFLTSSELDPPEGRISESLLEKFDAGVVAFDLAARVALCNSTYSLVSRENTIRVKDRLSEDQTVIGFPLMTQLPADWQITSEIDDFVIKCESGRTGRYANPPKDHRPVLYGDSLLLYLCHACAEAESLVDTTIKRIHAEWLLKPRPELDGRSPREILHEKRKFIDADLQSRSLQHSVTKDPPPPIPADSFAYRYAGFGTHEIVVYYDLIRFLLKRIEAWIKEGEDVTTGDAVRRLAKVRDCWLREPEPEYSGRTPAMVLESERRRENLVMSAAESIVDDDCPICVEMSQMFDTPMFWHLDGCNMDDEFAFSFHETEDEWVEEQAAWQAHMEEWKRNEILGLNKREGIIDDPDEFIALMRGEIPW